MHIPLVLLSIFFTLIFLLSKWWLERHTDEIPARSTSLAAVGPSSSAGSINSSTDKLSLKNVSWDSLSNYSRSRDTQKQVLTDLKMMRYKLAKLEQLLLTRGLNVPSLSSGSINELTDCTDDEGTH
ncbi:Kita-kyushu lung cancer antigen 1 [Manis javanica]|nr:Kita-kyushu lung cancer antigen 1 [Manis javanica]